MPVSVTMLPEQPADSIGIKVVGEGTTVNALNKTAYGGSELVSSKQIEKTHKTVADAGITKINDVLFTKMQELKAMQLSAEAASHCALSPEKMKFEPNTVIVLPAQPILGSMCVMVGFDRMVKIGVDEEDLIVLGLLVKMVTKDSPTEDCR